VIGKEPAARPPALPGLGFFEAIAEAANGGEVARVFRLLFDLFAKTAYMHIDRARRDEALLTPYRF
jgi:hypothetical protein